MPVITDIVPQKRDNKIFSVYVDEQYAFSLSERDLQFLNLKINSSLSQDQLQKFVQTYELQKAKNYAYRLVSGKSYSEKEIYTKLIRRFPEKVCRSVIKNLKSYHYIDDEKIIHAYAKSKVDQRPMGRFKLRQILFQKKFDEKLIAQTLERIFTEYDEYEMAKKLMEKHFKKIKARDTRTLNKMKNYLMSQGFSFEIIMPLLSRTQGEA